MLDMGEEGGESTIILACFGLGNACLVVPFMGGGGVRSGSHQL